MVKTRHTHFLLATSLTLLFSMSANAHASTPQGATGPYVDVVTYLPVGDANAWFDITWQLKRNFDNVCGDTFCGGEYSNIEALRYNCSVDQATGRIGMCAWTFAASHEEVDPVSGNIVVQKGSWRCRTALEPNITIGKLMTALGGSRPLDAPLPGSNRTIMDGLIDDCFF